jgi:phosphoribosylformylglycinamidine synthase
MLMVIHRGREDVAREIFEKWGIDFAVIGKLTATGRMVLVADGEVVSDIPVTPLVEASPEYDRPWTPSPPPAALDGDALVPPDSIGASLLGLLSSPDICAKRWVWEQYDHMVMADTVQRPGGDAAVVRIHGSNRGLAITTDCTPRYCAADPHTGGAQAVAEAFRNLTATGARPLAVTDCLNFGSPENSHVMGQFVGCTQGIGEACIALDMPVVSGNVSFYNETNGSAVQPTPAIGAVGLIDDLDRTATTALTTPGDRLVLIGDTAGHLGASLYAREIHGTEAGAPPPMDLVAERRNGDFVRGLIAAGRVTVCHDLSDGGLLVAVAEMCLAGDLGATLEAPPADAVAHAWLFGEDQGRYIIAVDGAGAETVVEQAGTAGVPARIVGEVGGGALTVFGENPISLATLRAAHENWLPDYMAAE